MKASTSAPQGLSGKTNRNNETFELKLYVAGETPKSLAALANLKQICKKHLKGKYRVEVMDLMQNPQLAQGTRL